MELPGGLQMAKIIQIVGPSGSGKSQLQGLLTNWLVDSGFKVKRIIEPGPLRDLSKSYLLRGDKDPLTEAYIFSLDRLMTYCESVFPRINEQDLYFLSDRGLFDTFVYQGLLGGVNPETIRLLNSRIPFPDLTLVLTVRGDVGSSRVHRRSDVTMETTSRNEEADRIDLLSKYYGSLQSLFPNLQMETLDTSDLTLEEVFLHCSDIIRGAFL